MKKIFKKSEYKLKGFSLVEILVVLGILSLMVAFIGDFEAKVFSFNNIFQGGNNVGFNSLTVLQPMVGEMRSMAPSNLGSFPIDTAATNTLIFYNDLNNNGLKERIRYFLAGSTLKRGVVVPTGSPLSYSTSTETFTTLAQNVINGTSTSIFTYYDSNYNGTASSTEPMPQTVDISKIRLVRVTLILDNDSKQPLAPVTVTSAASIRTLKDNL